MKKQLPVVVMDRAIPFLADALAPYCEVRALAGGAISAADVPGLATTIMDVVGKELKLAVRGINYTPKGDGMASAQITIEVPNAAVVDTLLHSLRRIKGVRNAFRIN